MRRPLFDDDGDQPFSRPSERDQMHIDFTPMIDCVVLLLGFFMVTSNLSQTSEVDVPPAKHGTASSTEQATIITVRAPATPDATPAIYLGVGGTRPGHLGDGEGSVKAYVEEGLRSGNRNAIIKADRDVQYGFVQEVTRAVSSVEGMQFSIGVRDVKAEREE